MNPLFVLLISFQKKDIQEEHFVRAGEIFFSEKLGDKKATEKLRTGYINERQFKYIPIIIPELQKFNKGEYKRYSEVVQNTMDKLMNQ